MLLGDTGRIIFCTRKQYVPYIGTHLDPRFVCPPDEVEGCGLQYLIATRESEARGRISNCVRMKPPQISTDVVDGRFSCREGLDQSVRVSEYFTNQVRRARITPASSVENIGGTGPAMRFIFLCPSHKAA